MKPTSVDEYIAQAPNELQEKLTQLRKLIKETAPQAEENISYSMPYYGYKGRLAYFAYAKHHIGLYLLPPVLEKHKADLAEYTTTKSAIHLPIDQEFPRELIKKLIVSGIKNNDETHKP